MSPDVLLNYTPEQVAQRVKGCRNAMRAFAMDWRRMRQQHPTWAKRQIKTLGYAIQSRDLALKCARETQYWGRP